MKARGIRALNGKGFRYGRRVESTRNVVGNILDRRFTAESPNERWTTDITYIWVNDKFMYLAVVMDLFSRKIIGWSLDDSMTEVLISDALKMAFNRRTIKQGLIIHSDRGVQYRSNNYQELINDNGCIQSMSRTGNCWDNAAMESFFSRLKVELIYPKNYQTVTDAQTGIFEYIEIFYNRKRSHSTLNNLSPFEFESKFVK